MVMKNEFMTRDQNEEKVQNLKLKWGKKSKGILYYELIESWQTVNVQCYNEQLVHLNDALETKRRLFSQQSMLLLNDNFHVANMM